MLRVNEGKHWNDAFISQGALWTLGNHRNLTRGKDEFFLEASEGARPCHHFDFSLEVSRLLKE